MKKQEDWFRTYQEWTVVAIVFCIALFGIYAAITKIIGYW